MKHDLTFLTHSQPSSFSSFASCSIGWEFWPCFLGGAIGCLRPAVPSMEEYRICYRGSLFILSWLPQGGGPPGYQMDVLLLLYELQHPGHYESFSAFKICNYIYGTIFFFIFTVFTISSDLSLENAQDIALWCYQPRLLGPFKCFSQLPGCEKKELTETETGFQSVYTLKDETQTETSEDSVLRNCTDRGSRRKSPSP